MPSAPWRLLKWLATRLTGPATDRAIRYAPVVGIAAGLGAIIFHIMCAVVSHWALVEGAGYEQGGPANEAEYAQIFEEGDLGPNEQIAALEPEGLADPHPAPTLWLLVLIPTIGGLISGIVVFKLAPEAEGHGTDAAIDAYHNKRGLIRPRVPLVKVFASAVTLGTGGSGGREGPIAQIGAGFGSFLATRLRLTDTERRVLVAAGMGAGIGAIFRAPLAGAIFAAEVLYRDPDFEAEALIPAFISTTIAYCVFCLVFGFTPLFEVSPQIFDNPILLAPLGVLAVLMALAAFGYTRTFYGIAALFRRLPIAPMWKPAIGAGLTGIVAVVIYMGFRASGNEHAEDSLSVLSFGYGFLQKVLAGQLPVDLWAAVALLAIVGVGKMVTTSLTIGSGGSGGVFGPSMVTGGALGAAIGLVFNHFIPEVVPASAIPMFTILGMASFFAAAANTPVSTLIMVSEMTASYKLLLPAMWVCAIAYLLGRTFTIYEKQVDNRIKSPAHRGDFIIDVVAGLTVDEALVDRNREFVTVPLAAPLREMSRLITETRQLCFPVVDGEGRYVGMFGLNDIREFLYESELAELAVAEDMISSAGETLTLQTDLSIAMEAFAKSHYAELPVVDAEQPDKVVALLRRQDVTAKHNARLIEMRQDGSAPD